MKVGQIYIYSGDCDHHLAFWHVYSIVFITGTDSIYGLLIVTSIDYIELLLVWSFKHHITDYLRFSPRRNDADTYAYKSGGRYIHCVLLKKQPGTKLSITSANVVRFSFFFTLGLTSDYVMNWSLRIPSHFKRVATLPCESLMFKNWYKSTLFNISCSNAVCLS